MNPKECEFCHENPGVTNSMYIFDAPASSPDCGDWVCAECEEQLRVEFEKGFLCPCGCEGNWTKCVYHKW